MNETISALLLAWYDQNARTLPWRGIHDPATGLVVAYEQEE